MSCYCKRNFPTSSGLFGYNKSAWFFAINLELTFFENDKKKVENGGHFIQIGSFAVFFQQNVSFYSKLFRLFNDSDSIIFETFSPLLLLVWVARSSIPKNRGNSSALLSIFGHLVEKKRCKSEFHRQLLHVSTGLFSALLPVTFRKTSVSLSFCDVLINVCVSVTFVYFTLNPTVNLSSDRSSGLSPPFSLSFFMFSQAFFATCKNKSPQARLACVTLNEKRLQS